MSCVERKTLIPLNYSADRWNHIENDLLIMYQAEYRKLWPVPEKGTDR